MEATQNQMAFHFKPNASRHCFDCLTQSRASLSPIRVNESVELFGFKFDASCVDSNAQLLFRMARQCLMRLDAGPHLVQQVNGTSDADYYSNMRWQLCDFLFHVRQFVSLVSSDSSYIWLLDRLIPNLLKNLHAFRLFVDNLGHISSYIKQSHNTGSKSSYHKLHAHLDICCYHLDILLQITDCQHKTSVFQDTQQVLDSNDDEIQKYAESFMSDLLQVSIVRFDKSMHLDLTGVTPFNCVCVQNVWLDLITILDKRSDHNQTNKKFWSVLNTLLDNIDVKLITEPAVFKLWILSHLAALYRDSDIPMQANYIQLEGTLKILTPDSTISESSLRTIIPLITPLVAELWPPKSEAVMTLWEYFNRRLNAMFLLARAKPDSMPSINKTSRAWLDQIKSRLEQVTSEDSWCLFLRLLGLHLRHSETKQWHQLRGRIYSKFSLTKLQALTEMGLYNFTTLFLTLCYVTDLKEASTKLSELLSFLSPQDSLRRHLLWRSHLALVQLYLDNDLDISLIAKPLVTELNTLKSDPTSTSLVRMFVSEMHSLLDSSEDLRHSEHILLDSWVAQYHKMCLESDATRLYTMLLALIEKVVSLSSNPSANVGQMSEALWRHVLPCILSSNKENYDLEARIGCELTLLANKNNSSRSFTSIFCRFINSQSLSVRCSQRYLGLLMAHDAAMATLANKMDNYQGLIVRTWLKCVILSADSDSDLTELTRHVAKLPEIQKLQSLGQVDLCSGPDPLVPFLTGLSRAGMSFSTSSSFYLSNVESCLTRTPLTTAKLATRIYKCAANFILLAPQFCYKSNNKNLLLASIMSQLLLPSSAAGANLDGPVRAAVVATLAEFVRALVALGPRHDPYINARLQDIIVLYLPKLLNSSKTTNTLDTFLANGMQHPLLELFQDLNADRAAARFVLETIATCLLPCKGKTPHTHSAVSLRFVLAVIALDQAEAVCLVAECCFHAVIEVATFADSAHQAQHRAWEVLRLLVNREQLRALQVSTIVSTAKKHLAFGAAYVFGLLERLVRLDARLVALALPEIRLQIQAVEQRRGVGYDRGLRGGLEKVEATVKCLNHEAD